MTTRLGKLTAPAALILAAALTLSACGDKATDDPGADTSKSSSRSSSSDGALTQSSFMTTVTAAQVEARTSHVALEIGLGGQSIKGEGDVKVGTDAAGTAMSLVMDVGAGVGGTIDMRLVDEVFYLRLGEMTQGKFAKIDLSDESNPLGKQYRQLIDQMDPSKQLEQFAKALTSFDKKGSPQKIDGVDAQPYEIVVDTAKIDGLTDLPDGAGASIPKTLTCTMFVGPDNLPRRIVTDVAGSKVTVDFSKWGEEVDIKAPSAAEVSDQDVSKLLSGAAGA